MNTDKYGNEYDEEKAAEIWPDMDHFHNLCYLIETEKIKITNDGEPQFLIREYASQIIVQKAGQESESYDNIEIADRTIWLEEIHREGPKD